MTSVAVPVAQDLAIHLLGASEAAAVLGLDKYRTPMDVWKAKVSKEPRTAPPSEAAMWGQALEAVVRGKYALDTGRSVFVPTGSVMLDGWLRATPDGFVSVWPVGSPPQNDTADLVTSVDIDDVQPMLASAPFGLLEVKTTASWNGDDWDDGPPEKVEVQCRVQMAVCNLPWCDVVCLIGGQRYVGPFRIERDLTLEHAILRYLRSFWHLVETKTPPPVDSSDAWGTYASEQMRPSKVVIEADADVREYLTSWKIARIERKRAEAQETELKTQLLLAMSAAKATGIDGGELGKVTAYRTGARMDWKGYAEYLEKRYETTYVAGFTATVASESREKFKGEPGEWTVRAPSGWSK